MIEYFETDNIRTLYNPMGHGVSHLQHLGNAPATFTATEILEKERDSGLKATEDVCFRALEK